MSARISSPHVRTLKISRIHSPPPRTSHQFCSAAIPHNPIAVRVDKERAIFRAAVRNSLKFSLEVDGFTGEHRTLRVDILQDVGDSVSTIVDRGQTEGGFVQGAGWLTLEELIWDDKGRLSTGGASTYKLPSWAEMPPVFNVAFLEKAAETREPLAMIGEFGNPNCGR